jgi:hypothetical protein
MTDDFRDDPAFLRDEAKRQAALATGAMREADDLRERIEALREALEWVYAEPEDTLKVQMWARAALDADDRAGGRQAR